MFWPILQDIYCHSSQLLRTKNHFRKLDGADLYNYLEHCWRFVVWVFSEAEFISERDEGSAGGLPPADAAATWAAETEAAAAEAAAAAGTAAGSGSRPGETAAAAATQARG